MRGHLPTPFRSFLLVMAFALAVAACGGDDDTSSAGTDTGDTVDTVDTTGETGETAPSEPEGSGDDATSDTGTGDDEPVPAFLAFTADDVRGGEIDGSAYAGEDLVVWFWAPWCTRCNAEAPDIAEVQAERGDEITFLGSAGLGERDDMEDFVARHGLDAFPHAVDPDGAIWTGFEIFTQSSFAFVDDDGTVEVVEYVELGADELNDRIDDLLAS